MQEIDATFALRLAPERTLERASTSFKRAPACKKFVIQSYTVHQFIAKTCGGSNS